MAATNPTNFNITNPLSGVNSLTDLIGKVVTAAQQLVIPVAVVMILWAGFNYMTAAGNPEKIRKANHILLYTVIGLAIIFIGGGFVSLITSILNGGR